MVSPGAAVQPSEPTPGGLRLFGRSARAALVFLTRLPLGGFPYHAAELRWAAAWFPAVGALVGALGALAFWLGSGAGPLAAGAVAVSAALLLTGALHEDGLADTADALGGANDRERLFAILKDSRIGTYGAAALGMALLLRVVLLARLEHGAPLALIVVGAWSRVAPVALIAALPYVTARDTARSRPLVKASLPQAIVATMVTTVLTVAAVGGELLRPELAALLLVVTVAVAFLCGWRFHARAGGITGDFLGATQQVGECALLLALTITGGLGP